MIKQTVRSLLVRILTWESKLIIGKYKPKIVAITGSVGKTSTKDAIAHVLAPHIDLRKSQKSFNSELGVPLTIIGCNNGWNNPLKWARNIFEGLALIIFPSHYPKLLVLEIGADRPGDIKSVTQWLKPDVSVITRIGDLPVHVEFFDSPKAVAKEKAHLASAVKVSGTLILNYDDEIVRGMAEKSKVRVLTYGFMEGADIRASSDHIVYEKNGRRNEAAGITFKIDYKGNIVPVRIDGTCGHQAIYAGIAAITVGVALDLHLLPIVESLQTLDTPPGRMKLLEGIKSTVIIDDTYNSSPIALSLALYALKNIETRGRKIAVLGDMMELGKYTIEAHKAAGFEVARDADMLFAVGQRAKFIAEAARLEGMKEESIFMFDEARLAGEKLQEIIEPGDAILIKGSQYVRMERTVEEIMAKPDEKEKLLVRQEKEWLART